MASSLDHDGGLTSIFSLPRPLVDRLGYVMVVVAEGPVGETRWWTGIIVQSGRDLGHAQHRTRRSQDGSIPAIHFGIGFSTEGYKKYPVSLPDPHTVEDAVDCAYRSLIRLKKMLSSTRKCIHSRPAMRCK